MTAVGWGSVRCLLGGHRFDQAQGRVGRCTRPGCPRYRDRARAVGYWVYADPPEPEPARRAGEQRIPGAGPVARPPQFAQALARGQRVRRSGRRSASDERRV